MHASGSGEWDKGLKMEKNDSLNSGSGKRSEREVRLLTEPTIEPYLSVAVLTHTLKAFEFRCYMNRSQPDKPFPVLYAGNRMTIQPTLKQLAQLRDEITAFLEEETTA
jgi:hypothetical protein